MLPECWGPWRSLGPWRRLGALEEAGAGGPGPQPSPASRPPRKRDRQRASRHPEAPWRQSPVSGRGGAAHPGSGDPAWTWPGAGRFRVCPGLGSTRARQEIWESGLSNSFQIIGVWKPGVYSQGLIWALRPSGRLTGGVSPPASALPTAVPAAAPPTPLCFSGKLAAQGSPLTIQTPQALPGLEQSRGDPRTGRGWLRNRIFGLVLGTWDTRGPGHPRLLEWPGGGGHQRAGLGALTLAWRLPPGGPWA